MITYFSQEDCVPLKPRYETDKNTSKLHDRAKFILLVQKYGYCFRNSLLNRTDSALARGNMVISECFSIELARYLKREKIEILRFIRYEPMEQEVVEFLVDNDMLSGNNITLNNAIQNSHATKEYRVYCRIKYNWFT